MSEKMEIYRTAYQVKVKSENRIIELLSEIQQTLVDTDTEIEQIFMNTDAFDDELEGERKRSLEKLMKKLKKRRNRLNR
jgi:hypothetical protein